jgi:hypothetical protein
MAYPTPIPTPEGERKTDRWFRSLVQCGDCSMSRLQEIRWGDVLLLRRDGTVELYCPRCGSSKAHWLVNIGR